MHAAQTAILRTIFYSCIEVVEFHYSSEITTRSTGQMGDYNFAKKLILPILELVEVVEVEVVALPLALRARKFDMTTLLQLKVESNVGNFNMCFKSLSIATIKTVKEPKNEKSPQKKRTKQNETATNENRSMVKTWFDIGIRSVPVGGPSQVFSSFIRDVTNCTCLFFSSISSEFRLSKCMDV